jgi:topoisomerase IA-like protein
MPIKTHIDKYGPYVQWGNHGAKYYFSPNSEKSFEIAHKKAIKQMVAAMYHGYRKK